MRLNPDQAAAVASPDTRVLSSCPGSGKTRTIVAKISKTLDEVRDTPRRIGCITYTNTAVAEIEQRLRELCTGEEEDLYEISTIHSFCLRHILQCYFHLVPKYVSGFTIFPFDSDEYKAIVTDIRGRFRLQGWAADRLDSIQRKSNGQLSVPAGVSEEAARVFIEEMDARNWITFNDVVFFSERLLDDFPFIARGIGSRFRWLLVDEFQDTSVAQARILEAIFEHQRTKIMLVGDPNQSIFGFAGAQPTLMHQLGQRFDAASDVSLTGNYRSSSNIITFAERLCPSNPPMTAVGPNRNAGEDPIFVACDSYAEVILTQFIPALRARRISFGEAAILGPQWPTLYHLARELRANDISVMGPGARPYRRNRAFSDFSEHVCAYVSEPGSYLVTGCQRALYLLLINIRGSPNVHVYSYEGKRVLCRVLRLAKSIHQQEEVATVWLEQFATQLASILETAEFLSDQETVAITDAASAMIDDIGKNIAPEEKLTVSDLAIFAKPSECIQLMTLHRSKGREFDAVAIVDLNEGKLPHFTADTEEEITEAKRLLYVGSTRARRYLMYLSKNSRRDPPTRFLGDRFLALR